MKLFLLRIFKKLIFVVYFPFMIIGAIIVAFIMPFLSLKEAIDNLYFEAWSQCKYFYRKKDVKFFLLKSLKYLTTILLYPISAIDFLLLHITLPFIDFKETVDWWLCCEVRKKYEAKGTYKK
ncbi:hypothetical protein [Treponema pedis]|uniref:hypothetical protein n=1 Tax=Treponema pedis TaxID=409322 RepID=UPI003143A79F